MLKSWLQNVTQSIILKNKLIHVENGGFWHDGFRHIFQEKKNASDNLSKACGFCLFLFFAYFAGGQKIDGALDRVLGISPIRIFPGVPVIKHLAVVGHILFQRIQSLSAQPGAFF